ncbi:MAG: sulfate respiration complex protein HmcD [Pseudomonadota bacterium]
MESIFYTYQDFYTHTKAITYILIIASLIGVACFWNFLAGKEDDENGNDF